MNEVEGKQNEFSLARARSIVKALTLAGVRDIVYCPGSRNAPFAYALNEYESECQLRIRIILDERSAGFAAIGLSRSSMIDAPYRGCPVALIVTSGTAVAELHPAVAEAAHSLIPLVIISADRPCELHGVGASQTTTQVGIFSSHSVATYDFPCSTIADHSLTSLIQRAVAQSRGLPAGEGGPVHLNVQLKDPLVPADFSTIAPPCLDQVDTTDVPPQHQDGTRTTPIVFSPDIVSPYAWEDIVDGSKNTVIIAGDAADSSAGQWAELGGIPLLAEPTSGVTSSKAWIPHQQSLLGIESIVDDIEQIIVTGRPSLSRPVSDLLKRHEPSIIVCSKRHDWPDSAGTAHQVVPGLKPPLTSADLSQKSLNWLNRVRAASKHCATHIAEVLDQDRNGLSALHVARMVWEAPSGLLVLGASNSIRAVDIVASQPGRGRVISNRGLAGIDGTIAMACGVAWGTDSNVRVLVGDLTFFYDASSLSLMPSSEEGDCQIIVIDDEGGSIFANLEHGRAPREFYERWMAVQQRTSISHLAKAYGWGYRNIYSLDELKEVLWKPISGKEIVHIRVPRDPSLYHHLLKGVKSYD